MVERETEYVEVAEDEQMDVDEGEGADATDGGLDNEDLDKYRNLDGPVWEGE